MFFHEQIYRSSEVMTKLKNLSITICGAGALGANITENLARSGLDMLAIFALLIDKQGII
ncbi:hypothetical protein D5R40_34980 [Okeania hirsuta]|uniref:THIF-type NAD/FAD binding fold domain-containing protein n=2 Tax=Okeania hirsuta TaxID=1458930 RepID=A0A3N6QFR0_9CYAN|nr:hypothetical protein D5R40_34980 [Okeania hirsuta]